MVYYAPATGTAARRRCRLWQCVAASTVWALYAQGPAPGQQDDLHTEDVGAKLRRRWDELHAEDAGVFRFLLGDGNGSAHPVRPVGRFLAQYCPRRAQKRKLGRTVERVVSLRDASEFHFAKGSVAELLLALRDTDRDTEAGLAEQGSVRAWGDLASDAMAVLVNVSPILRHHLVLVPYLASLLPQVLSLDAMRAAAAFLQVGGPGLRLLYNALGGAASVNHLHFQGYFLPTDGVPAQLPLELADIAWRGPGLGELPAWPLHTAVVEATEAHHLAARAFRIVEQLLKQNVPHHLLLRLEDQVFRAYVVARRLQESFVSSRINVAVNEATGWFICKTPEEFQELTEQGATTLLRRWRLLESVWDELDVFGTAAATSREDL